MVGKRVFRAPIWITAFRWNINYIHFSIIEELNVFAESSILLVLEMPTVRISKHLIKKLSVNINISYNVGSLAWG